MDRAVRKDRLAAPAQQHCIARPHAQRSGIGGHVGAAFIDDPDGAYRHADALEPEAIRLFGLVDHLAHRIRQDRPASRDRGGNPGKARFVKRQPVNHRFGKAARLARGNIPRVGGEDRRGGGFEPVGGKMQRRRALRAGHGGKLALRQPCFARERLDQRLRVFGSRDGYCEMLFLSHSRAFSSRMARCQACRKRRGSPFGTNQEHCTRRYAISDKTAERMWKMSPR